MRMRTLASFLPVTIVLSVCALTARGVTLQTVLGGGTGYDCSTDHNFMVSEGTGYNADLSVACKADDSAGSTVNQSCGNIAFNQVTLWSSDGFLPSPTGVIAGHKYCQGSAVWWNQASTCSATVNVSPTNPGPCSRKSFTATSVGK
jgi:hypothetical protein